MCWQSIPLSVQSHASSWKESICSLIVYFLHLHALFDIVKQMPFHKRKKMMQLNSYTYNVRKIPESEIDIPFYKCIETVFDQILHSLPVVRLLRIQLCQQQGLVWEESGSSTIKQIERNITFFLISTSQNVTFVFKCRRNGYGITQQIDITLIQNTKYLHSLHQLLTYF